MAYTRQMRRQFRNNQAEHHIVNLSQKTRDSYLQNDYLRRNCPTVLRVDSTGFTSEDFVALSNLINMKPARLRALILKNKNRHHSPININIMFLLMDAISSNPLLQTISFEGHSLDEEAAIHLAHKLSTTELRECDLTHCSLNATSLIALMRALPTTKLTRLIIADEGQGVILPELGCLLSSVVRQHSCLMELVLPTDKALYLRDPTHPLKESEEQMLEKLLEQIDEARQILAGRVYLANEFIKTRGNLRALMLTPDELSFFQIGGKEIVKQIMLDEYAEIPIEDRPTREAQEKEIGQLIWAIDGAISNSRQPRMFEAKFDGKKAAGDLPHSPRCVVK